MPRDYSTIVEELHEAQVELEELESIERHEAEVDRGIETLKEVQRTLEEISKDAAGTSKTIEEYRSELDGVVDKLKLANEEFGAALQEEIQPLSEAGGEVAAGVGQFGEAAGEVSSTLKEIADRLDQVEQLIKLGEAPASEILGGFEKYFGDLVDLLGPLADRLPGLGAFITIWLEAIRRIRGSIAKIEAITATRRAETVALRREVSPESADAMYVGGEGPVAKRRRRITELSERVESLRDEAAAHPDAPTPPPAGGTIELKHESDFALARKAVEGGGPTVGQLQEEVFWSNVALAEAKKKLAAWQRNAPSPGQQTTGGQSATELEAELERQRQALQTTTDQTQRLRITDRIGKLPDAIATAKANEQSTARGAELQQRVATAEWFAAKAQARLTALLNRIRDWLVNDLRARGPGSGRSPWNADDHTRFNADHPEIPITPEDVRAPVGALPTPTAASAGGVIGSAVPPAGPPVATRNGGRDRRPVVMAVLATLLVIGGTTAFATGLVGGPGESPTPSQVAHDTATPTPTVNGSALALLDFVLTGGSCPATRFSGGFQLDVVDGALTLTQLGLATEHVSVGTFAPNGDFVATGQDQTYAGLITGTGLEAEYTEAGGCTYDVRGNLTRPISGPYATVPAWLEFYDAQANLGGLGLLGVAPGRTVHVIIASNGQPDIRSLLPITVVLTVDGETVWTMVIEGDAAVVCRDATGCSANAPGQVDPSWAAGDKLIVVLATGKDGVPLAVFIYGPSAEAQPSGSN